MDIKGLFNSIGNIITNGEPSKFASIGMDTGSFGEYASEYVLNNYSITKRSYIKTIKNVYINKANGDTTELDVIALTEYGIFILESKNYSGWIFGSKNNMEWTQSFQNGEKHRFYNPIKQNETHRNALAKYLGVSPNCIFSYVIFSDRCTLKSVPDNTDHIFIMKRNQLLWYMQSALDNGNKFFIQDEIDSIYNKLLQCSNKSDIEKQRHIHEIKEKFNGVNCPVCGSKLVVRKGKSGPFYGCSQYPRCTYTRNIHKNPNN